MFFDPQCKPQVKADPFSLESLIAWLEKQPGKLPYCFDDTGGCLLHQYLTSRGFEELHVGGLTFRHGDNQDLRHELPTAFRIVARTHPHTFGAALERARKLAAGS